MAGPYGRNTLQGNGLATAEGSSNFEFELDAHRRSPTFFARGNFWGTQDAGAIDALIYDDDESKGNGRVDFGTGLGNALAFTATGVVPRKTATATQGAFVQKADEEEIQVSIVNLNAPGNAPGVPATNVVVAPNGLTLTFTTPIFAFPLFGVSITNPGMNGAGGVGAAFGKPAGSLGRKGCFVATAAYGDENAPEVRLLREWRDERLSDDPLGRGFVRAYYAVSPALAAVIADHEWLRGAAGAGPRRRRCDAVDGRAVALRPRRRCAPLAPDAQAQIWPPSVGAKSEEVLGVPAQNFAPSVFSLSNSHRHGRSHFRRLPSDPPYVVAKKREDPKVPVESRMFLAVRPAPAHQTADVVAQHCIGVVDRKQQVAVVADGLGGADLMAVPAGAEDCAQLGAVALFLVGLQLG